MLSVHCLSCPVCPVCDVRALWLDGSWQPATPRPWPHCVRWGPSSTPTKEHSPLPQFSAHICCGQMAAWIKMSLGMELRLGPADFVLDGDPVLGFSRVRVRVRVRVSVRVSIRVSLFFFERPFVKRFALCYRSVICPVCLSVLSFCRVCDVCALWLNGWTDQDETWHAGRPRPWLHCIRRGPSSPSPKGGGRTGSFWAKFSANICCGQMAAWIKMSLGMELGLGPGDFVLDGDPAPPSQKGRGAPNFRPMFIVAKRLHG